MPMSRLRTEQGFALATTIIMMAVMLLMGSAILEIVVTQARTTTSERAGESAFTVAEATLNAEAFLLGRSWPTSSSQMPFPAAASSPCSAQTMTGNLTTPANTSSLQNQVQSILAQTYGSDSNASTARWWVTACESGGRDAWDASLLNGNAYDTSLAANPTPQPRRMWVRAEAKVDGHTRSVVGLVQAGQQAVFPPNLAVATGIVGADLTTTTGQLLTGNVAGPLVSSVVGGSGKPYQGNIGLRCSLLDQTALLGCLSGLYKLTSMTTVAPLLQGNNYVDMSGNQAVSTEQVALLRQEAKASGTYYANTSPSVGGVANGASCLPSSPSPAGKVIFIEQVGDGTGSCLLNTAGGTQAGAVVVGSGGVRVVRSMAAAAPNACPASAAVPTTGDGTFNGVIYTLRGRRLAGDAADIRIECGSKVYGGVFADDNPALGSHAHGKVEIVPPQINMTTVLNQITSNLALCQLPIVGPLTCNLTNLLGGTLDGVMATLGISPASLAAAIVPQLNPALPGVTYDASKVSAVTTFGDSGLVTGTFRQVANLH